MNKVDDKTTTKIVAGIFRTPQAKPLVRRWVSSRVLSGPRIQQEIQQFLMEQQAAQVAMSQGNMGCPHEEGEDFSFGEDETAVPIRS
jgi:hypothetical protein